MFAITVFAFLLCSAFGFFFGGHIRGTTISGLKIALVIYPTLLCAVVGLGVFFFLGLGAMNGLVICLLGSVVGVFVATVRR